MPFVRAHARSIEDGDLIRFSTRTPMPIDRRRLQVKRADRIVFKLDGRRSIMVLLRGESWAMQCDPDRHLEVYQKPAQRKSGSRRFRRR